MKTPTLVRIRALLPAAMLLALQLPLVGCDSAFRAPMCAEDEAEFPPGLAGRYRLTLPTASPGYSGAFAKLSDTEFEIRDDAESLTVQAYGITQRSLANVVNGFRPKAAGTSRALADDNKNGDDSIGLPIMQIGRTCKIDGVYYTQQHMDDLGVYSLMRLDITPTSVGLVTLLFDPDELRTAGFATHFIPNLAEAKDGWLFDPVEKVRMVVDNVSLTSDQRTKLLRLAHHSGVSFRLERIATSPRSQAQRPGFTVRLPKRG